jgi:hypothetical protein
MLEKLSNPAAYPADAAQEILALLVESGSFSSRDGVVSGAPSGEAIAEAMIATHKALMAYYEKLAK